MMGSSPVVNGVCWGSVSPSPPNLTIPPPAYQDVLDFAYYSGWRAMKKSGCSEAVSVYGGPDPGSKMEIPVNMPGVPMPISGRVVYRWVIVSTLIGVWGLLLPEPVLGQRSGLAIDRTATLDGPPPPVPPEVLSRDATGRVTGRAVRLTEPLRVDGQLDEAVYATVPAMSDFVQTEPVEGAPATEKTEVWVLFDNEQVYLVARCWESRPDRMTVNEMRRDSLGISEDDNLAWIFDTLYDRRSGVVFEVNALGGRMDGQSINEGRTNFDWNPIWDVEVGRFDGGWTVEAALPFKSLRYRPDLSQLWGFNVRRRNRWKNELSYLMPISAAVGRRGLRAPLAAPLVGLEAPPASRNLEVKPYAISDLTSDTAASPPNANKPDGDIGLDVKFGITPSLTADFTYRTDFAQVEADEQQVNLTRFSLFFPEKREFFLENQGTFAFGGRGGDTPILFHSRRIGIQGGREIPVQGGGRLTGRLGGFDLGLIEIGTDTEEVPGVRATNFSVVRLKRDIFRQSSVGLLVTRRSAALSGPGANTAYGVDGSFSFLRNRLAIDTYWARTQTEGLAGKETSYRANLDFDGDRYGVRLERLAVGNAFNPEVGFVRRHDMRKSAGQFRFSPRLPSVDLIRKLSWAGAIVYIDNTAGRLETREGDAEFRIEFENSDQFTLGYRRAYEFLSEPFEIAPDIVLPVGGYDFDAVRAGFSFGSQRMASANVRVERGTFFSGHKTSFTVRRGRVKFPPRFAVEPSYSVNWVDLAEGTFTTHLVGSRLIYTMTPKMFTSSLVQYNSASNAVDTNVRFRWEYQPGSELFVVYDEQRDTLGRQFPDLQNRAFVVKVNRLIRF